MTNNTLLYIKTIAGSTREGRFSDKAAAWIAEEIKNQESVVVETLDLRDYDMLSQPRRWRRGLSNCGIPKCQFC